ncbi:MAG: hypothetical protein K6L76_04590 [Agarilytica sp.]
MNIANFVKTIAVPLVSVGTAVMVGLLNFQVSKNDQELRVRDQQLTERISDIDLLVKRSREEREERESNQDFNIRIYDIVTKSLEEGNEKKQEAAKAFVVVMVEEPLRSSLLNVLKQGGAPSVKSNIGQILAQEQSFKRKTYVAPTKSYDRAPSYNWGEWDFDIFWCTESSSIAKQQAEKIGAQLMAENAKGRVRIRELPESINAKANYQIEGYEIRYNRQERETAGALRKLSREALARDDAKPDVKMGLTRQDTPWYISVFVCP